MKTAMTISDVIRASNAEGAKRALSAEELDAVRGGDGYTVPYGSPQYGEWKEGYDMASAGSTTFWTGAGALAASTVVPPPADLMGAAFAGGVMATGGEQMDRGEAMMDHAQAQYEATLPQPDWGGEGGAGGGSGDGGYQGAGGYGNEGAGGAGGGGNDDYGY